MAARAKVVVNCVGPYRFYGEPVVKACVNNGAHHVDVSGEPQVPILTSQLIPIMFDQFGQGPSVTLAILTTLRSRTPGGLGGIPHPPW